MDPLELLVVVGGAFSPYLLAAALRGRRTRRRVVMWKQAAREAGFTGIHPSDAGVAASSGSLRVRLSLHQGQLVEGRLHVRGHEPLWASGELRAGVLRLVVPARARPLQRERDEPALRGVARRAVAQIPARLAGAARGQLPLADGEAGRLSLADDATGRLSLSADAGAR